MKPLKTRNFLFFIAVWLSIGTASSQEVNHTFDSLRQAVGFPGGTLSIKTESYHISMSTGLADVESKIKMESSDRMLLGSVGKTFVATLVLKLAEEGKLEIDDLASKYLGENRWFISLPNATEITIEHLLRHTSGIPEYVYATEFWQEVNAEPEKVWTVAERLAYIADAKPLFAPGSGWSYADANYIILGAIIEKVTGQAYYALLEKEILRPLNLKNTEPSDRRKLDGLVPGYTGTIPLFQGLPQKMAEDGVYAVNPQLEWTGGGLITTSGDLAKWIDELLNTKSVLNKSSVNKILSPVNRQTGQPDRTGYGYGMEIWESSIGIAYGHSGFMPGYMTIVAYYPKHDLGIAMQINMDNTNAKFDRSVSMYAMLQAIEKEVVTKR